MHNPILDQFNVQPPIAIRQDPISQILDPLHLARLPEVYAHNSYFIDFILYLIFFTGVARVSLEKRFPGRGGKLITLAIGLILSIALIITQQRMHFSLVSFGPFAAILLLTIIGFMFFHVLMSFGIVLKTAASLSYILIYVSVRAFVPSLLEWMIIETPILAGLLTLAFIFAIGTLIFSLWPKSSHYSKDRETSWQNITDTLGLPKDTEQMSEGRQTYTETLANKEQRFFEQLKQLYQALPRLLQSTGGQRQALNWLQSLHIEEQTVMQEFDKLQRIDKALTNQDIITLQKILKVQRKAPKRIHPQVLKTLQDTKQRIEWDRNISQLESKLKAGFATIKTDLERCGQAVKAQNESAAKEALKRILPWERRLDIMLQVMRDLQNNFKRSMLKHFKNTQKPTKPQG